MNAKDKMNQIKEDELNKIHSDTLGLTIPENYFSNSKNEILNKVLAEKETKVIPFYKKRTSWLAAASVTLLLGLSIFRTYNSQNQENITNQLTDSIVQIDNTTTTNNANNTTQGHNLVPENDIIVSSLFVEEKEIDEYITNRLLEDM
ncbi:hypothetical protein SAMN05192550_0662 [Flavobacterium glycines]|jgi:hypothetical protein|uniref:Uncharacterized protein n=1 Tax=Flavobacterium glycines TaxID=551990 RepID=A0A1B9DNM5_9FLAO|nr:hypothetical protein [Flavobacterium glycines]OCB71296.1 hypothetical protein FBGL_08585 [Flavobacterium glycines]GEL10306.1 hypothetical protein FGL01_10450 [Flavobacterium glycines]SDI72949.1 hypothetical protein SAMN05192550_0662 [Flavobacterium glycines]